MRFWNHCECPYPFVPVEVLEEYQLCDELGIHIDTNEHHGGINNRYAATHLITSVVARLTRQVRILSMGTLITVRPDPVRVAEGMYDLVRFFEDLLDELPYARVSVVGCSFGGWLAAELAVSCSHRLARLVLADAVGIKVSGR